MAAEWEVSQAACTLTWAACQAVVLVVCPVAWPSTPTRSLKCSSAKEAWAECRTMVALDRSWVKTWEAAQVEEAVAKVPQVDSLGDSAECQDFSRLAAEVVALEVATSSLECDHINALLIIIS